MLNIVARKPKNRDGVEYVVIDRGPQRWGCRYVSATVDRHSLSHDEWYWGHYFYLLSDALEHFNGRSVSLVLVLGGLR